MIADGGLATTLMDRGALSSLDAGVHPVLGEDPSAIQAVHRDFMEAGSQLLLTATFLMPARRSRPALAEQALRAARQASLGQIPVFASLGPACPPGHPVPADAYRPIVEPLLDGIDGIVLETFASPSDLFRALDALPARAHALPIVLSLTVRPDGRRLDGGSAPEGLTELLARSDQVGLNCGTPEGIGAALAGWDGPKLWLRPGNMGDAADWAARAARLRPHARVFGGCCGVGPAQLRALTLLLEG